MRGILLSLILHTTMTAAAQTSVTPWTLEQLMHSLASVKTSDATFVERKELAILKEPLVMTGTLRFRAPSYLKKQVLQPHEESYEADDDWLIVEAPSEGRRQFQLSGYPLIQAFVASVRATLAGDLRTLENFYKVDFQSQNAEWTLRLQPLDQDMAQYVTAILINGKDNRLLGIETREANGDRSLMSIKAKGE